MGDTFVDQVLSKVDFTWSCPPLSLLPFLLFIRSYRNFPLRSYPWSWFGGLAFGALQPMERRRRRPRPRSFS